jgi:hypothetical protein
MQKYTLVQHTGFSVGGKNAFKQAVEARSIMEAEVGPVSRAGGLIYNSYAEARDAAEKYNYPPENDGLHPTAKGTFVRAGRFAEKVFVPE